MRDDAYHYNQARWEALVEADALFTRPMLDLDAERARAYLDLERLGLPGDVAGRRVLCLAGGGAASPTTRGTAKATRSSTPTPTGPRPATPTRTGCTSGGPAWRSAGPANTGRR
ncbi:hypothetical protein [Nonomuraea sp. NPDC003214]